VGHLPDSASVGVHWKRHLDAHALQTYVLRHPEMASACAPPSRVVLASEPVVA
jgi:hypothetical protein